MQDSYDNWKKYNPKTDECEVVDNINNLNEGDVVSYPSARFGMYKQSMGRFKRPTLDDIYGKPPALTNEDRFIQHVIKEYETKGRI